MKIASLDVEKFMEKPTIKQIQSTFEQNINQEDNFEIPKNTAATITCKNTRSLLIL
jgi:hypothetical protein